MTPGRWCSKDDHSLYEGDPSFNDWLDGSDEDAHARVRELGLSALTSPSKALFAGDPIAYAVEAERFRGIRLARSLGENRIDDVWYRRNRSHFAQLVPPLRNGTVVPFIGAGVSCAASLPTWEAHLCNQAAAAGIDPNLVRRRYKGGEHEQVVDEIIAIRGLGLFQQSMRDDFGVPHVPTHLSQLTTMLTKGLIVTTNFDELIELAAVTNEGSRPPVILGNDPDSHRLITTLSNGLRAVLKLHGDILSPSSYILSGNQYDEAYGPDFIDMKRPLPRKLRRLFEQSTLLFIGYGLARDRTLRVFEQVVEEAGLNEVGQHFAILETPLDDILIADQNALLANLNINPIWYPAGEHQFVPVILSELLAAANS